MAPPEVVSTMPFPAVPRAILYLPLKREYFEQIRDGKKGVEYRLRTLHWQKRLVDRHYDAIVLTLGYPPAEDSARRIERPYRGYMLATITHKHFGAEPVDVFAIHVTP